MLRKDFADANKVERSCPARRALVMRFLTQAARLLSPIL